MNQITYRSDQLHRRHWLLGFAAATAGHTCFGQDKSNDKNNPASLYAPDEIDRAVKSGVEYLLNAQRENGSIADRGHEVAMTALAIMAMASIGVEPQTF